MAEAVADKKQVRDDEFGIHGDLATQAGDDSFVVLYDSAAENKETEAASPPSLEDLNETHVLSAPRGGHAHPEDAYIDDILSSDDVEPGEHLAVVTAVAPGDDGPIALTNEELDGILEMGPETEEQFHPDFPVADEKQPVAAQQNRPAAQPAAYDDEELPIAISDEDLDEILLEEEGGELPLPPADLTDEAAALAAYEPAAARTAQESPRGLIPEEEPIALADDELDHILAGDEPASAQNAPGLTTSAGDEILTLDEEGELDLIDDASSPLETPGEAKPAPDSGSGFFDSDEDEPITLSDEELDGILSTAPEEQTAPSDEVRLDEGAQHESHVVEDEEPIALSHEELDGILMDAEEPGAAESPLSGETAAEPAGGGFFDGDEDEPIALSADELDGIAATATAEEGATAETASDLDSRYADVDQMDEEGEIPAAEPGDEDEGPIALSADELEGIAADAHEITPEAPMVGLSPLDASPAEPSLAEQTGKPATVFEEDLEAATLIHEDDRAEEASAPTPDAEELKSVMGYLDNLLGELPDDVIEKFAQSEYFKLYQKIMEKLGL